MKWIKIVDERMIKIAEFDRVFLNTLSTSAFCSWPRPPAWLRTCTPVSLFTDAPAGPAESAIRRRDRWSTWQSWLKSSQPMTSSLHPQKRRKIRVRRRKTPDARRTRTTGARGAFPARQHAAWDRLRDRAASSLGLRLGKGTSPPHPLEPLVPVLAACWPKEEEVRLTVLRGDTVNH